MGQVVLSLPSDGTTIDASDVNTPFNTLVNEFNGNIDDNNIKTGANISGAKLNDASIPGKKFDSTTYGGWIAGVLPAVSSVAANGNRSYNVTFASTVASYLTPGQRIRTTRTSAAPTQCTSLNGTTQYWVKTSPNKLTFTDDFVVSAWIKLTSYQAGTIVSRYSAGSGWSLDLNGSGQIRLTGYSGGASNYRQGQSYQSLPLNKWVHIAMQLDMSTYTATTTTIYCMIDGVDVPVQLNTSGTNPTSLTQAGNLEIGSAAASTFFPGKIAQVAIYNAKVTQANILATISQGLTGSETSLASAYSFNNSTSDLNTSTPNDLSAGAGSPTATNADSPFGGQADGTISSTLDYGIVTKVSTTVATVQVPEGCTIPTTGGVTSVDMSAYKAPYNMPVNRGKWQVLSLQKTNTTQSSPSSGTWYNVGSTSITAPVGEWTMRYEVSLYGNRVSGVNSIYSTLSTGISSETDVDVTAQLDGNATADMLAMVTRQKDISVTASTPYYLNSKTDTAGMTSISFVGITSPTRITFELAYL